ncbi:lipoprotein LipL71 [Leptospira sp. 2 VSF19]|uniref:Lipoprotein LipL71 n=1 Tax=Leptospira soteropolitanensis TaxID=2950025 RepID=A0AAW5VIX9_9LEPT|nr:lipoprotein LipL71 [Leptospira soteropolitanensis]MCW7493744.1 lipoprotein LipL71 [Leptospira soteropolitanensis]MCW7501342.1 lipoprotein LipL71 [Leptospira soteropolitanensis]MCW7523472.1 lipoprotein LipL71 [Leptospira soteropolitanensis]MCW7527456.1 lipoprotein LipL71 [Leptospira soteropolitanensis]MCW7531312.1 lipoprotein LipL71 [Leptospira soteropolitanensis]
MLRKKKTAVFLSGLVLFSIGFVNCAQELPLKELALAKSQVERAERLSAEEFAPEEYSEAKKSLASANEFAAEEKASDSKKSADYAISKAYDALEKTLPKLAAKSREEAVAAIDAADEAYATEFSPEEFKKAVSARDAGETKLAQADASLASYLREDKDETAKELKRTVALQEYEDAHNSFVEATKISLDAKKVALDRSGSIRGSADEVDALLEKAYTYSKGGNPAAIDEEKAKVASAREDIEAGRLKTADEKIKSARLASASLLADAVKDHAKNRNLQAREVVEDANARFSELNAETYLKSNAKESYASTQENLGASNESLKASENLLEQEKYDDSIAQSEEAIRLAEISIDQIETLKGKTAVTKKDRKTVETDTTTTATTTDETTEKASSSQIEELTGGWKRYTVEKSNPADCLWRIADREDIYNDAKLWPRIFEANRKSIRNKNLIYPKQKLNIPPKTGKIGKAPKQ